MRIETSNDALSRFYDEETMGDEYPHGVEFSGQNTARVKKHVGEALVEKYDGFSPLEDDESDSDDETDAAVSVPDAGADATAGDVAVETDKNGSDATGSDGVDDNDNEDSTHE